MTPTALAAHAALVDWIYAQASSIDGEFGCCHSATEIRDGHGEDGDPLEASCDGLRVADRALPLLATLTNELNATIDQMRQERTEIEASYEALRSRAALAGVES